MPSTDELDELSNDSLVVELAPPPHVPGTVPEGLSLTARLSSHDGMRYANIESNYMIVDHFKDGYVSLSGFCGAFNPNVFAAAPDLLAALKALRNECSGTPRAHQLLALIAQADAAISKAEA